MIPYLLSPTTPPPASIPGLHAVNAIGRPVLRNPRTHVGISSEYTTHPGQNSNRVQRTAPACSLRHDLCKGGGSHERRIDYPIIPQSSLHLQALIFGGGIAGLWTLARLKSEGYRCLLLTDAPLGAGQTIASQGIIHGGIKYTLGESSDAGRRIAEMPDIWNACLRGEGEIDLRDARILSPHQHLWTTPGLLSRIAGFGASKVIRTAVAKLSPEDRPPVFAGAPRNIDLYRVDEPVLAIDAVVRALAGPLADRIALIDPATLRPNAMEVGGIRLTADRLIFAAGAGNEALLRTFEFPSAPAMQRRPLHMVVARFPGPAPAIFGHCLAPPPSTLPRLTITTSENVWYIGGQIAEAGVARSQPEQIAFARDELRACLPWLDHSAADISTIRIDRAEGIADNGQPGKRPDGPVVVERGNLIAAWPTKLAFAPALAADILERLRAADIKPGGSSNLPTLPHPGFAPYPWT